jgi:hypothetical protein
MGLSGLERGPNMLFDSFQCDVRPLAFTLDGLIYNACLARVPPLTL